MNRVIVRTFIYIAGRDQFGSEVEDTLETKARYRRLDIAPRDQVTYTEHQTLDRPVRKYLVRPAAGGVDYLYNEGQASEETRSLPLTWGTGQSFVDDGMEWTVRGVAPYDSAAKMLELVVRGAQIP